MARTMQIAIVSGMVRRDGTDSRDDEDAHHLLGRVGRRADVVAAEDHSDT